MKLIFNYYYQDAERKPVLYNDYKVVVVLNEGGDMPANIKNVFRNGILVEYSRLQNRYVNDYSYITKEQELCGFCYCFDDDKEVPLGNYFPQLKDGGERYLYDIRTLIAAMLRNDYMFRYIKKLEITGNSERWFFESPLPSADYLFRADSIKIFGLDGSGYSLEINKAEFLFPLDKFPQVFPRVSKISSDNIPFAIITKGSSEVRALNFYLDLKPTLLCSYDDENEYFWVLNGSFSYVSSREETGYNDIVYSGTFLASPVNENAGNSVSDFNKLFYSLLPLFPISVGRKNADRTYSAIFITYDDLTKDNISGGLLACTEIPLVVFVKAGIDYVLFLARNNFLRGLSYVRQFEETYFHADQIGKTQLVFYNENDHFYKWETRYFIKLKDGIYSLTLSFSTDRFMKFPVVQMLKLEGENAKSKLIHGTYECKKNAFGYRLLLSEWRLLPPDGAGSIKVQDCVAKLKEMLLSFEHMLSIRDFLNDMLLLERKFRAEFGIDGPKKIPDILDDKKDIDEWKIRPKRRSREIIIPEKRDTASEKKETASEKKETVPVKKPEEPVVDDIFDDPDDNTSEIDALRFVLSQTTDNNRLSISDALAEEISVIITPWLPIIKKASKHGISVREYISRYRVELPQAPRLAIMGEAGTGKSTIAKKLATECLGASFLSMLGSELKGAYVGWDKAVFAKRINDVQKQNTGDQPAVLFLDEAYTIFESNKNGNSFIGDIVEMLLKLCEEGEYDIDISEFSDSTLDQLGLSFFPDPNEDYSDESLYRTSSSLFRTNRKIYPKKIRKKKNTVIWLGGYEDRLRKSFQANEGLSRRFKDKLVIPSPKMNELWTLFEESVAKQDITLSADDEKKTKAFIKWASSKTRSAIFGNYAGIKTLTERFLRENYVRKDAALACEKAINWYRSDITKQYKAELARDLGKMPFEVVTDIGLCMNDYAGNNSLKSKINEIIEMMLDIEKYTKMHISLPKGALLMGPPGTGKTMLVKCMAGELSKKMNEMTDGKNLKDVAFIPTSAAEILATKNPVNAISVLFSEAAGYDAAVIFIDEIDTIGKHRREQADSGPLTQLMKEMDGFGNGGCIFIIAATNDPDSLDPALVREGRFDMSIEVGIPDKNTSEDLFRLYLKEYGFDYDRLDEDETVAEGLRDRLMNYLGGRVPAFIKANLNQAAIMYHRTEKGFLGGDWERNPLDYAHRRLGDGTYLRTKDYDGTIKDFGLFLRDLKEVIDLRDLGARRITDDNETFSTDPDTNGGRSAVAIHEIGHALTGLVLGRKTVEKITVLGRGTALGYVEPVRNEKQPVTKNDYLDTIKIFMGGRAAEILIYGDGNVSHGAQEDIKKATAVAKAMVGEFGFSDEIGFMSLGQRTGRYLGGRFEYFASQEYLGRMDIEVGKILKDCMEKTIKLLEPRKDILIRMAKELFEKKELTGDELAALLSME